MKAKRETVLIVDDDIQMLQMMKQILEYEGFRVVTASSGEAAIDAFLASKPNLVLLDIMMPDIDGLSVCKYIRESSHLPIIMVTALSKNSEVIQGLDSGADDYITKPFSAGELAARVRAVLRRAAAADKLPVFQIGDVKIDYATRQVTLGKKEIKLTTLEYKILAYLTQKAGQIITSEQLLGDIWGDDQTGAPHLIQVNIGRLRKKLGDSAREPKYIITRPGIGYVIPHPGRDGDHPEYKA